MKVFYSTLLPLDLKYGIIGGAIFISLSSGLVTLVSYKDEIGNSFSSLSKEGSKVLKEYVEPAFSKVGKGFSEIISQYKNWIDVIDKNKENIKKHLSISTIKDGFTNITQQLPKYYSEAVRFSESVYKNIKDMDNKQIRDYVIKAFELYESAVNMFSVFIGFFDALLKKADLHLPSFIFPSFSNKAKLPDDPAKTLVNSWDTFSKNSKVVSKLDISEKQEVIRFIIEQPEEFDKKIEELSKKDTWGNYPTKQEFLRDLLTQDRYKQTVLKKFASLFSECNGKDMKDCKKTFSREEIEEFLKIFSTDNKDKVENKEQ